MTVWASPNGFAELRLQPILDWAQSDTDNQSREEAIEELKAMDVYQNVEPSEGNGYLGGFSLFDYVDRAKELFREELNSDWTTAATTLTGSSDYEIKYHFTEPWQVFLAMEGLIAFDDDKEYPHNIDWLGNENPADTSQEAMIDLVYNKYVGDKLGALAYKSGILQIVGGGSSDDYLNRLTKEALGIPVLAGPKEATAIGNLASQIMHESALTLAQVREIIRESFDVRNV